MPLGSDINTHDTQRQVKSDNNIWGPIGLAVKIIIYCHLELGPRAIPHDENQQ